MEQVQKSQYQYYDPFKSQIILQNQERKICCDDEKELRTKVVKKNKGDLQSLQAYILAEFQTGTFQGSGTVNFVQGELHQNIQKIFVSCAHNFVFKVSGLQTSVHHFKQAKLQIGQIQNEEDFDFLGTIEKVFIPETHINDLDSLNGDDIAFGLFSSPLTSSDLTCYNGEISSIDNENPQPGDTIMIVGYPGEKNGQLFYMEGTISEILVRKNGTLITYSDIDTTKGQSGSPIYLKRDDEWRIIGVHVAYDYNAKKNIGTAITYDIFKWAILQINEYVSKKK